MSVSINGKLSSNKPLILSLYISCFLVFGCGVNSNFTLSGMVNGLEWFSQIPEFDPFFSPYYLSFFLQNCNSF